MPETRPLTVKVFQDTLGPKIPFDTVAAGFDIFQEVTPCVELNLSTMRVHIPEGEEHYIRTDVYEPKPFGADLGIFVTRRSLVTYEDLDKNGQMLKRRNRGGNAYITAGVAINGSTLRKPKLAMVSVGEDPYDLSVAAATAHELGHLVNVKKAGETYDGDAHCTDDDCLMGPVITKGETIKHSFCTECKQQVAVNAGILRDIKASKLVSVMHRLLLVEQNIL